MSTGNGHARKSEEMLEALESYLDGRLEGTAREQFERSLASDESLRGVVQWNETAQQRVNSMLARLYAPPAAPTAEALLARIEEATTAAANSTPGPAVRPTASARPRRRVMRAALAAGVLLLLMAGAAVAWRMSHPSKTQHHPTRTVAMVYGETVASGFKPGWVCENDQQLANTFGYRVGSRLMLGKLPEGTSMLGLAYSDAISPNTVQMLVQSGEAQILVFVDQLPFDPEHGIQLPHACHPTGPALHLYRKELGPLVLYELSPLAEARVLDALYIPQ